MGICLFLILGMFSQADNQLAVSGTSPWIAANYVDGRIPTGDLASDTKHQLHGGPAAACCIGDDTCLIATQTNCENAEGSYVANTPFCTESLCATGACCVGGTVCLDNDDAPGDMTESLCEQSIGGGYFGGIQCEDDDPCGLITIPERYEVIQITSGDIFHHLPRVNNCGEIVYHRGLNGDTVAEIFLYDNGMLSQLTSNGIPDNFPDTNDLGTVCWTRDYQGGENAPGRITMLHDGAEMVIGRGQVPSINNRDLVAWEVFDDDYESCAPSVAEADIWHFDGESSRMIVDDGYSNQSAHVNDHGQTIWTRYNFPCGGGFGDWTSQVVLRENGLVTPLPTVADTPQLPDIDEITRVAWGSNHLVEIWEGGQTTSLADGDTPALNNRGGIAYNVITDFTPWELRLYSNGQHVRLSTQEDIDNLIDNIRPSINNMGEVAWEWMPNGSTHPSGIRFMRRIRTGDVDVDDDVDIADFARFPGCYTGPVITDGLCVCRFLDIDHDRDVDWDDFNLFMASYTGPATDCMGRTMWDLADGLVAGTIQDCNVNGIDDECEIQEEFTQRRGERGEKNELTTGSDSLRPLRLREKSSDLQSLDANGNSVPDECDCPVFQAIHTNAMPSIKNRYISFTPRVSYWTPMTAFIDPPLEGKRAAIRVKLVDLDRFPQLNGQVRWVGPPSTYPDASTPFGEFIAAQLQCEPYYADWGHAEYMHVFGSAIVPNSTYEVQIVAESCTPPLLDESKFSPPVTIVTREWGDVFEPYDGPSQPNFSDITRLVDAFRQAEGAIVKPRAQLQPQIVNPAGNVTFADISAGVDGFRGFVYPYTIGSCP